MTELRDHEACTNCKPAFRHENESVGQCWDQRSMSEAEHSSFMLKEIIVYLRNSRFSEIWRKHVHKYKCVQKYILALFWFIHYLLKCRTNGQMASVLVSENWSAQILWKTIKKNSWNSSQRLLKSTRLEAIKADSLILRWENRKTNNVFPTLNEKLGGKSPSFWENARNCENCVEIVESK